MNTYRVTIMDYWKDNNKLMVWRHTDNPGDLRLWWVSLASVLRLGSLSSKPSSIRALTGGGGNVATFQIEREIGL